MVTLGMALREDLKDKLGGVVLVNPATSVGDTILPQVAELFAAIPDAVPLGGSTLSSILGALPDPFGLQNSPVFRALPNRTVQFSI